MRKSEKLIELLRWLKDGPKSQAEMLEKYDGRTIASARRRVFLMEYGTRVMASDRGLAFLVLEGE